MKEKIKFYIVFLICASISMGITIIFNAQLPKPALGSGLLALAWLLIGIPAGFIIRGIKTE